MPYSHLRDRSINDIYFRVVANYTYDWESWHDPQGKLVWVNDAVQRMTGFSVDECLRMRDYPLPIIAKQDHQRVRQMLKDAVDKKSYNDLEFEVVTRNGEYRSMAVSWQPMYDDDGKHLGFRTSVRDITERQGLKEQLRLYTEHLEQLVEERTSRIAQLEQHRRKMEKLAALGELAAGVAHEVNNPLAGIRNAFSLFRDGLDPQDEHYDLLELVDKEIERISSIIHQMYQLYRRSPQQVIEFNLHDSIREVLCLLEPIAKRHHVTLLAQDDERSLCVSLPESELKQVLFNLVRNAIQASNTGQTVELTVSTRADKVHIEVADHGCGIDRETLPHVFEPFFSTKNELKEGMGLGLTLSRNLIEGMEGSIHVTTKPGQGSRFLVVLPQKIDASQDSDEA